MIFSFMATGITPANQSDFQGLPFILDRAMRGEEPALVSVMANNKPAQ
jgi:hypothetical protein